MEYFQSRYQVTLVDYIIIIIFELILYNSFFLSVKFGRKIMYVNYLHELAQYLNLEQLNIAQPIWELVYCP